MILLINLSNMFQYFILCIILIDVFDLFSFLKLHYVKVKQSRYRPELA
jgi:hypothetical protein